MVRKQDCHGCDVTDNIFERYLSWKVASVVVLGLCIGISAGFIYTDRSIADESTKRVMQVDDLKTQDSQVMKLLYDIKQMQNSQLEAIARLEARNGIKMNHLVKKLEDVDRKIVFQNRMPTKPAQAFDTDYTLSKITVPIELKFIPSPDVTAVIPKATMAEIHLSESPRKVK